MPSKKRKQYDCIFGKTSTRKCLVPFSGNGIDICRLYETGQCCYDRKGKIIKHAQGKE